MLQFGFEIFTDPQALARFKDWVASLVELSHDALHMHVGLLLWVVLFVMLGRKYWSGWVSCAIVLAIAVWVEWMDFLSLPPTIYQDHIDLAHDAGAHDVINTILWPTILMLVGPWLFRKIGKSAGSGERGDEPFE